MTKEYIVNKDKIPKCSGDGIHWMKKDGKDKEICLKEKCGIIIMQEGSKI